VGCYSSSPLKQNLVPRFLSVVVRGAKTRLELDFKWLLFQLLGSLLSCIEILLSWSCRFSSARVDGWRVGVAEYIISKPHQDIFKVRGVRLSSMPEKIPWELEGLQLAIEVLKSRDFSGNSCWLGVASSLAQLDGIFRSWSRDLKLDIGVDL
jgi:hypothetical protein